MDASWADLFVPQGVRAVHPAAGEPSTSKGGAQKQALSTFPGTYCCCSKSARWGVGVSRGGIGEEAVPVQADTLGDAAKEETSHLHGCIHTETGDICNTAHLVMGIPPLPRAWWPRGHSSQPGGERRGLRLCSPCTLSAEAGSVPGAQKKPGYILLLQRFRPS